MANIIEITDLSLPQLHPYIGCRESELYHYFEPEIGLFIAESPKVVTRALQSGHQPLSALVSKETFQNRETEEVLQKLSQDVPIYVAQETLLQEITGFPLVRGMLCAMRRKPLPTVEEICKGKKRIAVLEDVVNPTNMGAIFRSAAAMQMEAVLLTPACTDPLYRRAIRVSMGTVFQIPWTFLPNGNPTLQLQEQGFQTAAMALREDTISIEDDVLQKTERLAIILGTEGEGLRDATISASDYRVKIPMAEGIDSLNVAAASAVAFWTLGRR